MHSISNLQVDGAWNDFTKNGGLGCILRLKDQTIVKVQRVEPLLAQS